MTAPLPSGPAAANGAGAHPPACDASARMTAHPPACGAGARVTAHDRFIRDTIDWIERRLLRRGVRIDADTPLFEQGLIDSLRILSLIAWTEKATGGIIPDAQIRMDNFHSVRRIAEVFVAGDGAAADRHVRRGDHVDR
jgi:acyl carrier protein